MKPIHSLLLIVLLFVVSLFIVMPALAQDDEPPPVDEESTTPVAEATIAPIGTEEITVTIEAPEPNPWLRFVQMIGNGINSFVGGASFMAILLFVTGKLSSDRYVLGLLETATQGLRDSYPPETRQWLVNLGTGLRNVGMTIEEVFDDIPVADKPDPNSLG